MKIQPHYQVYTGGRHRYPRSIRRARELVRAAVEAGKEVNVTRVDRYNRAHTVLNTIYGVNKLKVFPFPTKISQVVRWFAQEIPPGTIHVDVKSEQAEENLLKQILNHPGDIRVSFTLR